jgi:hypothetical protein
LVETTLPWQFLPAVLGRNSGGLDVPRHELMRALGQCAIRTGTVMLDNKVRLAPPSTISRRRE